MRLPAYSQLSKEQDRINSLPLDGSYVVAGPPGTGKTVVALYRASMLQKNKQKIRLLTYSHVLTKYLQSGTIHLNLGADTATYHKWVADEWNKVHKSSEKVPCINNIWYNYDWDAILESVNENPPELKSLPYLIVDEAQDVPRKFFFLAKLIANNVTVFADENQTLYEDNSTIKDIRSALGIKTETFFLTKNYRNTKQIAMLASHFHSGLQTGMPEIPTNSGKPITLLQVNDQLAETTLRIQRYLSINKNAEVGVLLPTTYLIKKYEEALSEKFPGMVQHYYRDAKTKRKCDTLNFDAKPAVRVVSYKSAKGLDFDAVFLPEIQRYRFADEPNCGTAKMDMYVLLSRARDDLFIFYSGKKRELLALIERYIVQDKVMEQQMRKDEAV